MLRHNRYAPRVMSQVLPPQDTPPGDPPPPETPPAPDEPTTPPVTPPETPPGDPATPDPEPKVFDAAYVESLRRENAKHRTEKKALQDRIDAIDRANMTELQKVQADLEAEKNGRIDLETKNRSLEVKFAASTLGIVDPEVAASLVDWDAIKSGTTIEEELNALLVRKPWLKGPAPAAPPVVPPIPATPPAPPNPGAPATPPVAPPRRYTSSELKAMTQAQMNAVLEDVKLAMAEGRVDTTR